jgi:hypothetical protein
MNLEIHKPQLIERVNAHIQAGHLHDADELIEKALDAPDEKDALDEKSPAPPVTPHGSLHEFLAITYLTHTTI